MIDQNFRQLVPGFAAATLPVSAAAITTDTEGLESGEVRIDTAGFAMPAYYARPQRSTKPPVVLVVQEIFGVHEHIRDLCRRLAKSGYYAIAPELYARQGDPSQVADMQEIIQNIVSKVPDKQVLSDLDASVEFASSAGQADARRLAICGFCWGGRIVWIYSAHRSDLKAGAAWYGKLTAGAYSRPAMQQRQPVEVAGDLHGAILGLYGGQDTSIPLGDVEAMRTALRESGRDGNCEIVVYPEAGHAFNADYRPSYHEASAQDAWGRMMTWFATWV